MKKKLSYNKFRQKSKKIKHIFILYAIKTFSRGSRFFSKFYLSLKIFSFFLKALQLKSLNFLSNFLLNWVLNKIQYFNLLFFLFFLRKNILSYTQWSLYLKEKKNCKHYLINQMFVIKIFWKHKTKPPASFLSIITLD